MDGVPVSGEVTLRGTNLPLKQAISGNPTGLSLFTGTPPNIQAIEQSYQHNSDSGVGYIDTAGSNDALDEYIFSAMATIGSTYEIVTSSGSDNSVLTLIDLVVLRPDNKARLIDQWTDALLAAPKQDSITEGLLDSGVYRDFRANHLGVRFGLLVFTDPLVLPPE